MREKLPPSSVRSLTLLYPHPPRSSGDAATSSTYERDLFWPLSGSLAMFRIDPLDGSVTLIEEVVAFDAATSDLTENDGLIGLFGGTAGGIAAATLPFGVLEGEGSGISSTSGALLTRIQAFAASIFICVACMFV